MTETHQLGGVQEAADADLNPSWMTECLLQCLRRSPRSFFWLLVFAILFHSVTTRTKLDRLVKDGFQYQLSSLSIAMDRYSSPINTLSVSLLLHSTCEHDPEMLEFLQLRQQLINLERSFFWLRTIASDLRWEMKSLNHPSKITDLKRDDKKSLFP